MNFGRCWTAWRVVSLVRSRRTYRSLCFVYTCRRLIDLSLIAGTSIRSASTLAGGPGLLRRSSTSRLVIYMLAIDRPWYTCRAIDRPWYTCRAIDRAAPSQSGAQQDLWGGSAIAGSRWLWCRWFPSFWCFSGKVSIAFLSYTIRI